MKTVAKNLLYNIFYQILIILLPLITAPYISRVLGAEKMGIYSYTYSVAYYFLLFAMLGISNYGNRLIASTRDDKDKLNKSFWEVYAIQFFMYIFAIILYVVYTLFINKSNNLITWLQIIYVTSGLLDISWLFFGLEKFKITVTRNTIIKILTVVLMFVFVKKEEDLWKYTLIMALGTFLSQLYLWFQIKKYINFTRIKIKNLKKHIKPILILFIPVIAYSIYKVMDKIMLGSFSTYEQVGFYQSSEKIINIPMGVITAIGTVMMPRMSNIISKGDKNKVNDYIKISIKLVTIVGAAITFGIIGTSNILAPVYFGEEFAPCSKLLMLLSLTIFSLSWANVARTQVLIPQKKDKSYVISTIVGALINLVINILLIPKYGANGAAVGTIFAEFFVMIIQVIIVNKEIPIIKFIIKTIPFMIFGFIMMICINFLGYYLGQSILTLILQVCTGSFIYIILSIIYLIISKDEFLNILKRKKKMNDNVPNTENINYDTFVRTDINGFNYINFYDSYNYDNINNYLDDLDRVKMKIRFDNSAIKEIDFSKCSYEISDVILSETKVYNFEFNNDYFLRKGFYPKQVANNYELMKYILDYDYNYLAYIDPDVMNKDILIDIINYAFTKVYYLKVKNNEIDFDINNMFKKSKIIKNSYFKECYSYIDKMNKKNRR